MPTPMPPQHLSMSTSPTERLFWIERILPMCEGEPVIEHDKQGAGGTITWTIEHGYRVRADDIDQSFVCSSRYVVPFRDQEHMIQVVLGTHDKTKCPHFMTDSQDHHALRIKDFIESNGESLSGDELTALERFCSYPTAYWLEHFVGFFHEQTVRHYADTTHELFSEKSKQWKKQERINRFLITHITYLCLIDDDKEMEALLNQGADPNANDGEPLSSAARLGAFDVAEILMDHGAVPTLQASAIAKAFGHMDVADLIKARYEQDRLNRQLPQANQSEGLSQTPQASRKPRL